MTKLIYLILAILCSSSIALIFKHSETNNMNRLAVTTANYFTALIISLIMILIQNKSIFSNTSKLFLAMSIGAIAGIFFFLSFIYYQKSVKKNGAGLAGVFSKLGILLPMLISIVLWKEFPTSIQWVGIILAIFSIIIVNFPFNKNWKDALKLSLILLFFYGGIAEFSNKLFQRYASINLKPLFLFFVFSTAFIISLFVTIKDKKEIKREDLLTGVLVGIPNLFSSFFLINALDLLKAAVVFPIFSAGSIVVISLGGFLIYNERLNRREFSAIIMTIIALILINM
ncbi:MAG: EamA family transporter [Bacillota bacterium]